MKKLVIVLAGILFLTISTFVLLADWGIFTSEETVVQLRQGQSCDIYEETITTCSQRCLDYEWNNITREMDCLSSGEVCKDRKLINKVCNQVEYMRDRYYEINGTMLPIEIIFNENSTEAGYDSMIRMGNRQVHFKEDPTAGPAVKVQGDYEVTFQPMALNFRNDLSQIQQINMIQSVTGSNQGDYYTYNDAYGPDIDLRYIYQDNGVKEELVIHNKTDLPEPEAYMVAGGGLTVDLDFVLTTNASKIVLDGAEWDQETETITYGDVYINDADNNSIYFLPAPFAVDSEGDVYPMGYQFKQSAKKLYVVLKLNYSFLNDSNTSYPVYLDPSIYYHELLSTLVVGSTAAGNDTVAVSYPGIYIRRFSAGGPRTYRTYYKINLTDVPDDATIIAASWSTNPNSIADCTDVDGSGGCNITTYEVYDAGTYNSSNLTWATQPCGPTTPPNNSVYCDISGLEHAEHGYPGLERGVWNITAIVNNTDRSTSNYASFLADLSPSTVAFWEAYPLFDFPEFVTLAYDYVTINFTTTDNLYNISGCVDINTVDDYGTYYLTEDIVATNISDCINIRTDNVTLDCQGYTISGNWSAANPTYITDTGIYINAQNVTIQNCGVQRFDTAGIFVTTSDFVNLDNNNVSLNKDYGIFLSASYNVSIVDNDIYTNNDGQIGKMGIYIESANNVNITSSRIYNNSRGVGFSSVNGRDVKIEDTVVANNTWYDLDISHLEHCNMVVDNVTGTDNKSIAYYNADATLSGFDNNVSQLLLCGDSRITVTAENIHSNKVDKSNTFFMAVKNVSLNITNTTINNSYVAMQIKNVTNLSISNVTLKSSTIGLNLWDIINATIVKSRFTDNLIGISVSQTEEYGLTGNISIYNNYFSSYENFWDPSPVTGPIYFNVSPRLETTVFSNTIYVAGNFWYDPFGTGFSEPCTDATNDSICDSSYAVTASWTDYLPMTDTYQPDVIVEIENKPLGSSDTMNGTITYNNYTTWIYNETKWFNNSVELTDFENLTQLSSSNLSSDQIWTFSARVYDGTRWSNWKNDTVVINDTTAPVINRTWIGDVRVPLGNNMYFYINLTDDQLVEADACKITLFKQGYSDFEFNETTDTKSGDVISKFKTSSLYGVGTLEWRGVYCEDASGNEVNNVSVNLNVTITEATPAIITGGGGGSTSIVKEAGPEINVSAEIGFCGDGICDDTRGEDPLSCPRDCVPDLINLEKIFCTPLFNCGNWKTSWFINAIIIIIIAGMLYGTYRSKKKGRLK